MGPVGLLRQQAETGCLSPGLSALSVHWATQVIHWPPSLVLILPVQDKSASLAELKELCVGQGQDRGGSGAENGCPTLACQAAGEPQAAVDPHKLQCGPVKGLEAAQHSGQSHDLSLGLTPFSPAVGRAEGLEPKRASPASLLPPCPNPAQVQELGFLKALCKHTDQQTPEA